MKTIVFADTHCGVHKDSIIFLNQTEVLFKNIYDKCIRENINNIIIAGDLFHERKSLNVDTICRVTKMINDLNPINVFILLGNHDTYYKNIIWPYSPYIFNNMSHVKIIDKPTIIDNITFLPWSTNHYNVQEYNTPVIVGHFEIDGFPATCTDLFRGGQCSKEFEKFELVISGHFHIPCRKGNILYCGSPYHITMADRGSICGYYVLDNTDITFIENKDFAKYIRITSEDVVTKEQIEGNIVEISYIKDYGTLGNIRRMEKIQSMNPLRLSSNFTNISITQNMQADEDLNIANKSNKDILKDYLNVAHFPNHIKKSVLIGVLDKLLGELNVQ
jgi:hypothetical protein